MYRLLDHVSPIDGDCGRLCGSICCTAEDLSVPAKGTEIPKSSDNILLQHIEEVNKQAPYKMLDDASTIAYTDEEVDEEQPLGIYLYPGEESLFLNAGEPGSNIAPSNGAPLLQYPADGDPLFTFEAEDAEEYEYPDSWTGHVWFAACHKAPHCERCMRPLQCRFYPAAPHFDRHGQLTLIYFPAKTPYKCPLIEERYRLNRDFLKATYTVCLHLLRDPQIYDLFLFDSAWRREDPDFDENALRLYP